MVLLDTHIWVWWVHDHPSLKAAHREQLRRKQADGLGVSVISCWEVAKLVEYGRLSLPCPVEVWFEQALSLSGIQLIDFTPNMAVESTRLGPEFHRDPADQIIVATARVLNCPLLTVDERILSFKGVQAM